MDVVKPLLLCDSFDLSRNGIVTPAPVFVVSSFLSRFVHRLATLWQGHGISDIDSTREAITVRWPGRSMATEVSSIPTTIDYSISSPSPVSWSCLGFSCALIFSRKRIKAFPSSFLPWPSLPVPQNESICPQVQCWKRYESRYLPTGLASISSYSPVPSNI